MKFLVFQHIAAEHPGVFRQFMRREGIAWDVVALNEGAPIPELSLYDALLIFGGPMDVWQEAEHPWLIAEKAAVREFVNDLRRPFLGICLGHQLLADALGGRVGLMTEPEVGVGPLHLTEAARRDPLFCGMTDPMTALQWHGAEVKKMPDNAVLLAHNQTCPIQAMRLCDHAYGLQYHVEIEERTISEWGRIPVYRQALERLKGPDAQLRFEQDALTNMSVLRGIAETLFNNFCILAVECRQQRKR